MKTPAMPPDEPARLAELRSLSLLDTPSEERFDRVTRLAQRLFDVPIALVSLVDDDRQWFKSRQGLEDSETGRDISFCGHAIVGEGVMTVADTAEDDRFNDNPLVSGEPGIRFYAGAPIAGPRGSKLGTLCIIDRSPRDLSEIDVSSLQDLASIVEQEIASLHLATVDELTGLSNRRGFELLASKVLDICRTRDAGATLLYLDLDGLKLVNDQHGHEEGDQTLQEFASILERTLRGSDVVARLGGDEFVVLLAETDTAGDATKRLRRAIDDHNRESGASRPLSVSIGASTFDPSGDDSLEMLLRRADEAMYAAKRAGAIRH